jgi:hypothetical protein
MPTIMAQEPSLAPSTSTPIMMSSSPSSRGYVNSINAEVHYTFIDNFGSKGALTTPVQTSTSTTTTMSTTTRTTRDSTMSADKRGYESILKDQPFQWLKSFAQQI